MHEANYFLDTAILIDSACVVSLVKRLTQATNTFSSVLTGSDVVPSSPSRIEEERFHATNMVLSIYIHVVFIKR